MHKYTQTHRYCKAQVPKFKRMKLNRMRFNLNSKVNLTTGEIFIKWALCQFQYLCSDDSVITDFLVKPQLAFKFYFSTSLHKHIWSSAIHIFKINKSLSKKFLITMKQLRNWGTRDTDQDQEPTCVSPLPGVWSYTGTGHCCTLVTHVLVGHGDQALSWPNTMYKYTDNILGLT